MVQRWQSLSVSGDARGGAAMGQGGGRRREKDDFAHGEARGSPE
jgi:hypothetical protein